MNRLIIDKTEVGRLYTQENLTGRDIAKIFNVSVYPIFSILKELGIVLKKIQIRDVKKYILDRVKIDGNGCWNYIGKPTFNGYGRIRHDYAHRVSYEAFKNEIPDGMTIDHLCKNKMCINPDHMEVVTPEENVMRSGAMPAINARKTHCLRGHLLSGDNLAIYSGKRQCRTCFRERYKKYHKKGK